MASERLEGAGSMGEGWTPSAELLEERTLLSGLPDGLADLAAGAPVEEAPVMPEPPAEEPPAVVAPPPEVPASAVAAHDPASVLTALAADSSAEAPAARTVSVPVPAAVSSIGVPAGSAVAPAMVGNAGSANPAAVEASAVPGPKAVDSLLETVAVESESHAGSPAADSNAAQVQMAAEGEARVSAHAVQTPTAGSLSAHGAGLVESRVDARGGIDGEVDCVPADEDTAQPYMTADVSSSGERTAAAVEQEAPTIEDNQSEVGEARIERSLLPPTGDQTASAPGGVAAAHETTRPLDAGAVRIAETAEVQEDLVSRVSQLFDLVPNWPGVDLDAVEDAARSQVEDGGPLGADFVEVVSTHDLSCWATAAAGSAIGLAIARRELGLHLRDTADGPADEDVALCWSVT